MKAFLYIYLYKYIYRGMMCKERLSSEDIDLCVEGDIELYQA